MHFMSYVKQVVVVLEFVYQYGWLMKPIEKFKENKPLEKTHTHTHTHTTWSHLSADYP